LYSKVDVSRVQGDFSRDISRERKSAKPKCPRITKEKRVKLKSSIDCTQEQQSLNIPEVDSISERKSSYFFWTKSIQEKSKKLLSCTKKDYKDLVLDLSNSSLDPMKCANYEVCKRS
jgi:hypothetical protein